MGTAPTPPGLLERILLEVDRRIAAFARSGFLRNATITKGGITIRNGFLRVQNAAGTVTQFFVGGISPTLPDGTPQPGMTLRREDGTLAMALYDPTPDPGSPGGFKQFLAIYDRSGNIIFSDDTESGQGHARPRVPLTFYRARSNDWPQVTSTTFETVYRAKGDKQQPRLNIRVWGVNDSAGATGEVRVMVNGVQLGTTGATSSAIITEFLMVGAVAGSYGTNLVIEVQARMVAGAGGVRVGASQLDGLQS
ncbi:hypothetical protein [Blastococcus sp. CT_GayMR16]|uniref:hypothetical protein n=1 Tax=Blastococcus sp. CT_GayMR16 TaxID=2559607 RepID=UPI00107466AB|nr:hypothetical protein [Blastococcus sp. CT_GayMR16]TFV91413.1 hypothetical protein E4P38_02155 [Blastococcus sp. CT_GayMR16]